MLRYITLTLALVSVTFAYRGGAPDPACDSLTPGHGTTSPQNATVVPVPYAFTVLGESEVENGGTAELVLDGGDAPGFKGFVIVAETIGPDNVRSRVGKFSSDSSLVKIACIDKTGLTHNSNDQKSNLRITWTAPDAPFTGTVSFWGTFVQSYTTYWTVVQGTMSLTVVPPATTTFSPPTTPPETSPTQVENDTSTQQVPSSLFPIEATTVPRTTSTASIATTQNSTKPVSTVKPHISDTQGKGKKTVVGKSKRNNGETIKLSILCLLIAGLQWL